VELNKKRLTKTSPRIDSLGKTGMQSTGNFNGTFRRAGLILLAAGALLVALTV
jgi:hypothetical protein